MINVEIMVKIFVKKRHHQFKVVRLEWIEKLERDQEVAYLRVHFSCRLTQLDSV